MSAPYKITGTATPDGYVVRRFWVHTEDAYKWLGNGRWLHSIGADGPWLMSNGAIVPAEVLAAIPAEVIQKRCAK